MTDMTAAVRIRADGKFFYFHMSLVCLAVAYLGFLPSYWMPLAQGSFKGAPVTHLHGLIYFTWAIYFVFQSWLGASRQIARHRAVGLAGVSLATAMVIFGVLVTIERLRETAAAGSPQVGISIAVVALSNVALFAVLIALALANIRKPEWHKRLMLMAGISILQAPMARWFLYFHIPARTWVDLLLILLMLVPVLHDWRMRGRVHAAYWGPVAATIALYLVRAPFSGTPAWQGFAVWVSGLAG